MTTEAIFTEKLSDQSVTENETKANPLMVDINVLDQLMNRAGELVLVRNQMLQALNFWDRQEMKSAGQRLDLVTSELQESIMRTRMQPIASLFNSYATIIEETSGKEVALNLEGSEVELDKSIIEGLRSPLTHLINNALTYGIESPENRLKKGKKQRGEIILRAIRDSGHIIIEIEDDGQGLDCEAISSAALTLGFVKKDQLKAMSDHEKLELIMLPGFSTSAQSSDIIVCGLGFDIVKGEVDKFEGLLEIVSTSDTGTLVRIKLPLTLAIIPCLLIESGGERFALPQVNVSELIRISSQNIRDHIDKIGDADVLKLRGELIPLFQLHNVLNLRHEFFDVTSGRFSPDRRNNVFDERLLYMDDNAGSEFSRQPEPPHDELPLNTDGQHPERRFNSKSDVCIAVLNSGSYKYGLIIDEVHDTQEIVIKPLGRQLKKNDIYTGATIMGDGRVVLIVDVARLGIHAGLNSFSDSIPPTIIEELTPNHKDNESSKQSLLIFRNGHNEHCAVPLHRVARVEQIEATDIELKGGKKIIKYCEGTLPVYALEEVAHVETLEERDELIVIIFEFENREVGLLSVHPLDVVEEKIDPDEVTLRQPGICGSAIIKGQTTLLVDIDNFFGTISP